MKIGDTIYIIQDNPTRLYDGCYGVITKITDGFIFGYYICDNIGHDIPKHPNFKILVDSGYIITAKEAIKQKESKLEEHVKKQKQQIEDILKLLEKGVMAMDPQLNAAEMWCDVTNRLIRRYKRMSEINPEQCIKELTVIEEFCSKMGYLEDIKE